MLDEWKHQGRRLAIYIAPTKVCSSSLLPFVHRHYVITDSDKALCSERAGDWAQRMTRISTGEHEIAEGAGGQRATKEIELKCKTDFDLSSYIPTHKADHIIRSPCNW